MLQKLREQTHGWVTKLIIGTICFIFIVWGFEKMITPGGAQGEAVATLDGTKITQHEFNNAYQNKQFQAIQQNKKVDEKTLHTEVLNQLIKQKVLLNYTKNNLLQVSDSELGLLITSMPAFQNKGSFDRKRFNSIIKSMGITPMQFKESFKEDMLVTQLKNAIVNSGFITDRELSHITTLKNQKRDISWSIIDISDIEKKQPVTDSEIKEYYNSNAEKFMLPEKVKVDYISLNKNELLKNINISNEKMLDAYDEYVDKETANIKPKISIIVLNIDKHHTKKNQLKQAELVIEKLHKGHKFAELAKTYSDDKTTAKHGGELVSLNATTYGQKFDDTVSALMPEKISKPIETDTGNEIIIAKRIDNGIPNVKPLKEKRVELLKKLQKEQLPEVYDDKMRELGDLVFEHEDLIHASKSLNLPVITSEYFSRHNNNHGITQNKAFIDAAFSHDVLKKELNSDIITISADKVVALHLREYLPAKLKPLENVKNEIIVDLKKIKAQEFIVKDANRWIALLNETNNKEEKNKLTWISSKAVIQDGSKIKTEIAEKAFSMPFEKHKNNYGWVKLASGSVAIIKIDKIIEPSKKLIKTKKEALEQTIVKNIGDLNYKEFVASIKNDASIKILSKDLEEQ